MQADDLRYEETSRIPGVVKGGAVETQTIPIPPIVRQALGDQALTEFIPWMEEHFRLILRREGVPRDEYRALLSRLDGVEREVALLRGEMGLLRTELRSEIRDEVGALRAEFSEFQKRVYEQLDRVHMRIDELSARVEARLAEMDHHLEARLDAMNTRWETRLQEMNARWEARLDRMDERLEQMYRQMMIQTRWLIGALLGIGTVISVLLAIAQFTP